ncbi:hypothetical protein PROFUN_04155, partial [Planoprotostelium fungivorum]
MNKRGYLTLFGESLSEFSTPKGGDVISVVRTLNIESSAAESLLPVERQSDALEYTMSGYGHISPAGGWVQGHNPFGVFIRWQRASPVLQSTKRRQTSSFHKCRLLKDIATPQLALQKATSILSQQTPSFWATTSPAHHLLAVYRHLQPSKAVSNLPISDEKKETYYVFIGTQTEDQYATILLLPDLQNRVTRYSPPSAQTAQGAAGRKLEKNYTWLSEGVSQMDPLLNLREDTCKKIEQRMTQVPVLLIEGPPYSGKTSL